MLFLLCSDIFLYSAFWMSVADARSNALFSSRNPFSKSTLCQTDLTNSAANYGHNFSFSSKEKGGNGTLTALCLRAELAATFFYEM